MATAFLPGIGAAQSFMPGLDRPAFGPRIRITPFVGQAPAVSRLERWTVTGLGLQGRINDYDVELGSGPAAGVSLEVLAMDRFAFVGSVAMVSRGRTREYSSAEAVFHSYGGSNFLFAKGALAVRLNEEVSELQVHSLTATVFAGPAWIREMPKDDSATPAMLLDPLTHWAINFGANAEIPLGWNSFSLQAGVEDYYTWWNNAEVGSRNDAYNRTVNGLATRTIVEADPSHMWLFRVGMSFRLQ
jgi:hypothetical protein